MKIFYVCIKMGVTSNRKRFVRTQLSDEYMSRYPFSVYTRKHKQRLYMYNIGDWKAHESTTRKFRKIVQMSKIVWKRDEKQKKKEKRKKVNFHIFRSFYIYTNEPLPSPCLILRLDLLECVYVYSSRISIFVCIVYVWQQSLSQFTYNDDVGVSIMNAGGRENGIIYLCTYIYG